MKTTKIIHKITQLFLRPNKYSRPGTRLTKVTKIAVHYIGNPGTSALANRNYFNSLADTKTTYASSHYIIGLEGEIIQCIPENEIAYCTNSANSYSISIENCHPTTDGKFTDKTRKSLIELCADICERYNLDPEKDIIRHYDVSGKVCPKYWVVHPDDFVKFKKEVKDFIQNGGESMIYLTEEEGIYIKNRIRALEDAVKIDKIFNKIEDVPEWGKEAVKWYIDQGCINGDDKGLSLTYSELRILVITYKVFAKK